MTFIAVMFTNGFFKSQESLKDIHLIQVIYLSLDNGTCSGVLIYEDTCYIIKGTTYSMLIFYKGQLFT